MYRVGQVPDHVQRSYREQNRWMYVAPVRKVFTWGDFVLLMVKLLALGMFIFAVCMVVAMYVRM